MNFLSGWPNCRCYVSFREGTGCKKWLGRRRRPASFRGGGLMQPYFQRGVALLWSFVGSVTLGIESSRSRGSVNAFQKLTLHQWLFLVPLKGGR